MARIWTAVAAGACVVMTSMLGDMAAEVWRESDIALISPSADAPLYLLMREVVVCTEGAAGPGPRAVVQPVGDWSGETITLEPVDELRVLSVCDNIVDIMLPDHEGEPRVRRGRRGAPRPPAARRRGERPA